MNTVPRDIFKHVTINSIPKNMHPIHHKERRNARAKALEKLFKHREEVVYVDAAEYKVQDKVPLQLQPSITKSSTSPQPLFMAGGRKKRKSFCCNY